MSDTTAVPLTVILHAKCRKCEACLAKRAAMWRLRAQSETAMASRTWFGTITLRPEEHHKALSLARLRASKSGIDFDLLPAEEQFAERVRTIGPSLGLYLKRVRKTTKGRLRYLLVAEAHESGLPHFHMLIHEVSAPVREAALSGQWTAGFTKWRLVPPDNPRAATYLCKYLSKDARARVRASGGYGQGPVTRPLAIGETAEQSNAVSLRPSPHGETEQRNE